MELVEMEPLAGSLVGLPGVDGLSVEQRKRLTIAVELCANPAIVFMVRALPFSLGRCVYECRVLCANPAIVFIVCCPP